MVSRFYPKQIFLAVLTALAFLAAMPQARAQDKLPDLPPPIQNLVNEGAQIRYIGRFSGLDGWIAIQRGREQYFYVTEDGQAILMGLLFGRDGKLKTMEQVQSLKSGDKELLDMLARGGTENDFPAAKQQGFQKSPEFETETERLYSDIEGSNWITLGDRKAPYIYMFVDPQCPYCHAFMDDLRKAYIESGKLQVRLIPVGFKDETRAQAAFLLSAPDAQSLWFRHLDGDKGALPAKADLNQQGIQRNLAVMQAWKFSVTPLSVYKAANGEVKIIRGRASDMAAVMKDLQGQM